jgi:large subunit ribosomal protein L35Ae
VACEISTPNTQELPLKGRGARATHVRVTGRLYVKGVMMGFKRGLRNQHENTAILKIENVKEAAATPFYVGKRVCYIYK